MREASLFLGRHDHIFLQVQSLEEGLDEFQAHGNPEFPGPEVYRCLTRASNRARI